eukprot:TRINITY_DN7659_c0_g2_i1.p1 TRINITY_DN7659_c0_g2~~TRINITY_DN7659_c0_g2_i1.p1  ORF type:complete len:216 (+),score=33.47 TRINITY_DN7659_c0_g2_i1:32-679(+)
MPSFKAAQKRPPDVILISDDESPKKKKTAKPATKGSCVRGPRRESADRNTVSGSVGKLQPASKGVASWANRSELQKSRIEDDYIDEVKRKISHACQSYGIPKTEGKVAAQLLKNFLRALGEMQPPPMRMIASDFTERDEALLLQLLKPMLAATRQNFSVVCSRIKELTPELYENEVKRKKLIHAVLDTVQCSTDKDLIDAAISDASHQFEASGHN